MGVFVCVNCSAVHRRMGTHISKVKSTNLDEWNSEWVAHMKQWGNKKANLYWEAELPDYETRPDGTNATKSEAFIRDK